MKIFEYINNGLYVNALIPTESYSGYINIDDNGKVYKSKHEQTEPLSCIKNIETEVNKSPFFKDRVAEETLQFPYQLSSILVNVNDPVNYSIYNTSLDKLYDNLIYLYNNCYLANNNMPAYMFGWYGQPSDGTASTDTISAFQYNDASVPAKNFGWQQGTDKIIDINLINNIKDAVVFSKNNKHYMFAITTNNIAEFGDDSIYIDRLICLKFDDSGKTRTVELIINTNYIDDKGSQDIELTSKTGRLPEITYANNITFKNLQTISSDGNRFIYVLDNKGNHVYVYDVFNIINDDKIFKNRLLLYRIIGDDDALGNTNTKFVNAKIARYINNQLMVLDVGDDSIKIFGNDGNWIKTSGGKNFKNNPPADITYDSINDCYYILNTNAKISVFNNQLYIDRHIDTNIYLDEKEVGNKLYISYNNSNILYVLTNFKIYKKFITKLQNNIGSFSFEKINVVKDKSGYWNYNYSNWENAYRTWYLSSQADDNPELYNVLVKCLAFHDSDEDFDNLFVVINSRILRCEENVHYYTLFTNNLSSNENYVVDFDIYDNDHCDIKEEYVQGFTYNKSIFKFNYCLNEIISRIGFYPETTFDSNGSLFTKTFKYVNEKYSDDISLKIYDNENVDVNVINRIFTIFYNKMEKALNSIQTVQTGVKTPLTTTVNLL